MGYDFSSLSSIDFEELVCDLLQADHGRRYELFKAGKDNGIDGRSIFKGTTTIVQAKHYLRTGYSKLIDKLRQEELPKVTKLKPDRYIVATSLPLSPANKSEIQSIFSPYIKKQDDVLGQDDLNALLRKHRQVEQTHFKLWLGSQAVLDRVINNAELTQSEQLVRRVQDKFRLFVQHEGCSSAIDILNKQRFVIISGEPGIGKTTLADLLLYSYMQKGYRPVEVRNPKDAYKLYNPELPTIYYYDDFLGLTCLGDSFVQQGTNDIVKLIELVSGSKNARMVITSREFVLSQARQCDERMANSGFLDTKYQLRLGVYTKLICAKILFNHLYFSVGKEEYLEEIVRTHAYKHIITHVNYSPRIIAWMTSDAHLKNIEPKDFPRAFMELLKNPKTLWEIPFNKHISQAARNVLLVLFSLGGGVASGKLRECFLSYHQHYCDKHSLANSPDDYTSSMDELLGSFLRIEKDQIYYHNPSVKDFIESRILKTTEYCQYIVTSALYFEQIWRLWSVFCSKDPMHPELRTKTLKDSFLKALTRLKDTEPLLEVYDGKLMAFHRNDLSSVMRVYFCLGIYKVYRLPELLTIAQEMVSDTSIHQRSSLQSPTEWCELLSKLRPLVAEMPEIKPICERIIQLVEGIIGELECLDHFVSVHGAMCFWDFSDEFRNKFKDLFGKYAQQEAMDEVKQITASSEIEAYLSEFEALAQSYDFPVEDTRYYINEHLDEAQKHEEERADYDYETYKEQTAWSRDEDRQIDNMFTSLRDR